MKTTIKKALAAILFLAMIFSLAACGNKKTGGDISVYNNAIAAFNSAPGVKMDITTTLTVKAAKNSSTTVNKGTVYISNGESYCASADFTQTINSTNMPFSVYAVGSDVYFCVMGQTFKASASTDSEKTSMKTIVSAFSTDMFLGLNGESLTADNVTSSDSGEGKTTSFDVDPTSVDGALKETLYKLLECTSASDVSFTAIHIDCTTNSSNFPTELKLSASVSSSAGTSDLSATLTNEEFSGEIPVIGSVDTENPTSYDLQEILKVIEMM